MEPMQVVITALFAFAALGWGLWLQEKHRNKTWWTKRIEEKNECQRKISSLQTENGKLQVYEAFYAKWQHAPALQDAADRLRVENSELRSENRRLRDFSFQTQSALSEHRGNRNNEHEQTPGTADPGTPHWPWKSDDIDARRLRDAAKLSPAITNTDSDISAEFISKSTGEVYRTTLFSCSCMDFTMSLRKRRPCKHILSFAICIGVIDIDGAPTETASPARSIKEGDTGICIAGSKFAFCGRMKTITQSQAAAEVEKRGGIRTPASGAEILIVGDHPPASRVLAAAQAGAKMISEQEFISLLQ